MKAASRFDFDRVERHAATWFVRLFGAALIANVVTEIDAGVFAVHTGALYPWRHVPLVPLYPPFALIIEWSATAIAGALMITTKLVRPAFRVAACACFAAILQRYSNHGALLLIAAVFVALDPPDLESPPATFETKSRPNFALCRAQLAIVYVASALNKVVHGFQSGDALATLLHLSPNVARPLAISAIALELALPVALVYAPRVGVAGVVIFHAGIALAMPALWSFGLAMISLATLYLSSGRGRGDRTRPC